MELSRAFGSLQRVLEHCTDKQQCQFIVDEILESVCALAQDQYGNYVTQVSTLFGCNFNNVCVVEGLSTLELQ